MTRIVLVLIVLSLSLGACQRIASTAGQESMSGDLEALTPDSTLVVYWHALTGFDEDLLLELIDDFNANNAWGITVVGEYQGDLKTIHDKILTGLSSGKLPSLIMTDPSLAAVFAFQDIALSLSTYLESNKWGFTQDERDDFFPSALTSDELPQFRNRLYSFPFCRSLQVVYYNADWLKELGYDAPPQTWDEFRELACAASKPADGSFGFEFGMDSAFFNSLLATQNAPILNPGATAYTLGGEQSRDALQFLQDLISDGCTLWETEEGHLSDFAAGKVLLVVDSTDELPAYERAVADSGGFVWSFSGLPYATEEPLVSVHGVSTAILSSNPEEQLAAWLFIKWLAEPEQQARWAQHRGCFPIRRSALEDMETYLEEHLEYSRASRLLEQRWITEPGVTGYETCRAEIGRMLYAVTAGESVEQWLTYTLSLCNQALADETE